MNRTCLAVLTGLALWFGATTAVAQIKADATAPTDACAAITMADLRQAARSGEQSASVLQKGLRSALERYEPLLEDARIGPVTTAAAVALCRVTPLPPDIDAMAGVLALTARFASLEDRTRDWLARVTALPSPGDTGPFNRRFVMMAGPPAVARRGILGGKSSSAGCNVGAARLSGQAATDARRGLAALYRADSALAATGPLDLANLSTAAGTALPAICAAYGLDANGATALQFAGRLGQLEARVPGAVAALGDPAFASWVLAGNPGRARRLLGTVDSAYLLLAEFLGLDATPDCLSRNYDSVSMLADDIENLKKRPNLAKTLKAVTGSFATSSDLAVAVSETLGIEPEGCVAGQVKQVIEAPSSRGETFAFSAEAMAELQLDADLRPLAGPMQTVSKAKIPDKQRWEAAMTTALNDAVAKLVTQDVEAAAAAAAQAATEVPTAKDTALPRFAPQQPEGAAAPPKPPTTKKPAPGYTVTGDTLRLLAPKLNDPGLLAALRDLPQTVLASRDAVRKSVELGLQDYADAQRDALASRAAAILGLPQDNAGQPLGATALGVGDGPASGVVGDWTLTPEMIRAISADIPALAPLPKATLVQLETIKGIDYPNRRLFGAALKAKPALLGAAKLDGATPASHQLWPIFDVAQKLADPAVVLAALEDRGYDASVDSDCGCAPQWIDLTTVYAFYPFWDLKDPRTGKATRPLLDFETVDRVAFHGLEVDKNGQMDTSRLEIWEKSGASFVLSAHQHKAKADLSVRLRGWRNWIAPQSASAGAAAPSDIKAAAEKISANVAAAIVAAATLPPPNGLPGATDENLIDRAVRWLNQLWLSASPDGVTLVIDDYDGAPPADGSMLILMQLLTRLSEQLADKGMTLNIAIDIPLQSAADGADADSPTRLFQELRALLMPPPKPKGAADGPIAAMKTKIMDYLGENTSAAPIDRVLVFLQRPTSDAKKILRRRIEDSFQGQERADILRKIVPIVPDNAHNDLYREEQPGFSGPPVLQIIDDFVYFQGSFGGVGFWPSPSATVDAEAELMDEVLKAFDVRRAYLLPTALRAETSAADIDRPSDFCDLVCTNRAIGYIGNLVLIGAMLGLIVASYFSWRIDALTRNTLILQILLLALIASNLALAICANGGYDWARLALVLLIVGSVVVYQQITRWRRGVLP